MKTIKQIDEIMQTIPDRWRGHWCNGIEQGGGGCACRGCVQIGNRLIMASKHLNRIVTSRTCDPEHIDESRIPKEIYDRYKLTKEEWESWLKEYVA